MISLHRLFEEVVSPENIKPKEKPSIKSKLSNFFKSKKEPKYKYKRVPVESNNSTTFGNINIPKSALMAPAAIAATLYL